MRLEIRVRMALWSCHVNGSSADQLRLMQNQAKNRLCGGGFESGWDAGEVWGDRGGMSP